MGTWVSPERLFRVAFSPFSPALMAVGGESHVYVLKIISTESYDEDLGHREGMEVEVVAKWRLGERSTGLDWRNDEGRIE